MAAHDKIVLHLDDGEVVRGLDKINRMIKGMGKIELNTEKTSKGLDKASRSSRRFGHSMLRFAFSSLVVVRQAMNAFNSGMKDLEEGLRRVIQLDAGFMFKNLAVEIQRASFGFLDLNQAMSFAKGIQGLKGANAELAVSMARLATIASLTNPTGVKDAETAFERLQKAFITGHATKELSSVSKPLYDQMMIIEKTIPLYDKLGRRMAFAAAIAKVSAREIRQFGFMINDPFFKLLEAINKIRNSMKGMGQVIKGVGAIALGVLGPLGVGMSAFAFGPVPGLIGTIVGGILSAAMGSFTVKALNKLSERDDALVKIFEKLMFWLKAVFAPLTNVGPEGQQRKQRIIIPEGLGMSNKEIKQFALDAVNIGHGINRFADRFLSAGNAAKDLFMSEEGAIGGFKAGYNAIMNEDTKALLKSIRPDMEEFDLTGLGKDILYYLSYGIGALVGGLDFMTKVIMYGWGWLISEGKNILLDILEAIYKLNPFGPDEEKFKEIEKSREETRTLEERLAPTAPTAPTMPHLEKALKPKESALPEHTKLAPLAPKPPIGAAAPGAMVEKRKHEVPQDQLLKELAAKQTETNTLLKQQNEMWRRDQAEAR